MTIIETIRTHNTERFELAEALAQTFEDIDTCEHLLPALLTDSQTLAQLKQHYWYANLAEYLANDVRIARAITLESDINGHLQLIAQCHVGSELWHTNCQLLLNTLAELHTCDTSLGHLAQQKIKPSQLEGLGAQFQLAYRQAFTSVRVA